MRRDEGFVVRKRRARRRAVGTRAAIPDTSISGHRVVREPTGIIAWRGKPMQNGYGESFNNFIMFYRLKS